MAFRDTASFLDVDITPKTPGNIMFSQKELFKTATQVIAASGDGLAAFSGVGDVITGGGAGAGGFNNDLAWVAIDLKNGRSLTFQQISIAAGTVRVKYATARFTAGAPSATQTPATAVAADEEIIVGGGTDAAPTGEVWFGNLAAGDASRRLFGAVDGANSSGFWFVLRFDETFGNADHCWAIDPVQPFTAVGDTDPYTTIIGFGTASDKFDRPPMVSLSSTSMRLKSWYNKSTLGPRASGFERHLGQFTPEWDDQDNTSGNPNNNAWDLGPMFYERDDTSLDPPTPTGIKGFASLVHTFMPVDSSVNPIAGRRQTFNVNGVANAFLRFQACALPWDGSLPPDRGQGAYTQTEGNLWIANDTIVNPAPSRFRMRADDSVLLVPVYWNAPFNDGTGTLYPGPGAPSNIVLSALLGEQ